MAATTLQQAFDQAMQHHHAGRPHEAEGLCRQILAQQPNHADATHLLGVIAQQTGRHDIAVEFLNKAIVLRPGSVEAHANLGKALKDKGRLDEAIAAYRQAIALMPESAATYNNLGNALRDKGCFDEAVAAFHRAISLNPNFAEAHANFGNVLRDQGHLDEAIAALRRSIALKPNFARAHSNLGSALKDKEELDEAIAAYRRAIALEPGFAGAHNNLGNILAAQGQLDEAIAAYRQAISLRPGYAEAHTNLLITLQYHAGYDAAAIAEEHRRWNLQHAEPLRQLIQPHKNNREPDRQLRVGYVSPDLQGNSGGLFLLPLFRHRDRRAGELVCYSDVRNPDDMTARLRGAADEWHNIVGRSDEAVAEMIREHGIDILVDLAGHTAGNRLRVLARRPAPVQVTYLGYPGTTGLSEMDYRLTDALADPPGKTESLHSEKLWRLPVCAWCYGEPEDAPPVRAARADGPICFGTFNKFSKASPAIMELWAAILNAVPSSRLLMKSHGLGDAGIRRRISQFFEARGVQTERLELRGSEPDFRSHLEVYNQMDIALDTFPYHGTRTTCEALWMSVPVVTLAGQAHVSRVGVSLLDAVGLPELIAQSPQEYVSIAARLAADLPRLAELRRTVRGRMRASALMDGAAFTRNVEAAYRQMWRTWCAADAGKP